MPEHTRVAPHQGAICIFGTFAESPQDTRATELRVALEQCGYRLTRCHIPLRESGSRDRHFRTPLALIRRVLRILLAWIRLIVTFTRLPRQDLLLVPYPSHLDVLLARVLAQFSGQIVVMDAFLGLHDTVVCDRALCSPGSLTAWATKRLEHWSLRCADRILVDTAEQARMLSTDYNLPINQFVPIPLGIDESLWKPATRTRDTQKFRVLFWGTFIPLHGVETILAAVRQLHARGLAMETTIIGWGQTAPQLERLLALNPITGLDWRREIVAPEVIAAELRESDCALGVFGTSGKVQRVIPYKVYQTMASGRALITSDTPAIRDVLQHEVNALLIPAGDPEALAAAIARLASDREMCRKLGDAARQTFETHLARLHVRESLTACIDALLLERSAS